MYAHQMLQLRPEEWPLMGDRLDTKKPAIGAGGGGSSTLVLAGTGSKRRQRWDMPIHPSRLEGAAAVAVAVA
eukprot:CAMPEP_0178555604 /NCGR_PEP_ID=MMETSP0697-20121206/8952_1 /TAXON_ID=265572 /ORGANISM="Extubocellulus spinifer, Strain CCMP396" /LENGTH=71 /DNA_ID=CAMNT_0020188625 /DNA_START=289 /DNA_END=500 /DNA_ORIENTATION=-